MKEVGPIKDMEMLKKISKEFKRLGEREYLLFRIGVYMLLRISDILTLKVSDFLAMSGENYYIKDEVKIRERKTKRVKNKRPRTIMLNYQLGTQIGKYIKANHLLMDDYLFFKSWPSIDTKRHIGRSSVHRWFKLVEARCGIYDFASHSMRKTGAWYIYNETKDLAALQMLLGHSSMDITSRYIGLDKKCVDHQYELLRGLKF